MIFMKLLRVKSSGFKNCADDFCIDMLAKSKKTSEDKEYELNEIDEGLYTYSTVGIVGKNASGKTSALELLDWCYDILSTFRLSGKEYNYAGVNLEIIFYEEGYIYKYQTELDNAMTLEDNAIFKTQKIYQKKYYKTKLKEIYSEDSWQLADLPEDVPEDVSSIFWVLKKNEIREVFYGDYFHRSDSYNATLKLMKITKMDERIIEKVFRIFDENVEGLEQVDTNNFVLTYMGKRLSLSDKELFRFLSSGTTKGFNLYILAIMSLQMGFDLVVDEIENHFHKTLVENLILLYKDKNVNKKNATLIFSTHYCELLDLFNRSDNIWITHSRGKVEIKNMYENYELRTELLKSKKFYQNAFDTAVNYEALMDLKKELM